MTRLALFVAAALVASACSTFSLSGDAACGSRASGSLSASVDGEVAKASCVQGAVAEGTLDIRGSFGDDQVHVTIPGAQQGQTYALGGASDLGRATYSDAITDALDSSEGPGASDGTVTLDAVSASGARGTFAFTARRADGSAVEVARGQFDIEF